MNNEELSKLAKVVANNAHILSTPIDFDQLLQDGLIKKIGKSYYTDNIQVLPEGVAKKIKSVTQTKKGMKITFHKETRSIQRLAEKMKHLRD